MTGNFLLFLPETLMLLTALALFVGALDIWSHRANWVIAVLGGLASLGAVLFSIGSEGEPFFAGIYRVDDFSQFVKAVVALGFVLVAALCVEPQTVRRAAWSELPMFLALSSAGMMMLVSATELLTLYVSLELSAYPIYVLVALHRDRRRGSEAAVKYMLQGMVASAVSIYGISFLYGLSGSLYLSEIAAQFAQLAGQPLFWIAVLLAFGGFLFKLAVFPFHYWAPDTYQGAPHQVVAFIATASKVAAVALLCRLVGLLMGGEGTESAAFQNALMWFSVAAMTVGNLAALVQRDLKRLLGWSAVAHAGYLMIGLQAFSDLGLTSALFYAVGYFAMSCLVFLVVCEVARDEDFPTLDSLSGLYLRSPFLAFALLIGVFGLTGLPPTVGFIGKWFLFSAALENGQFALVLVAAANSAVALYYYLRIVRQAYYEKGEAAGPLEVGPLALLCGLVAMAVVLWMGTAPGAFWEFSARAAACLQ